MERLALIIGYAIIGLVGVAILATVLMFIWTYLSCAIHHAYIANKAFKTYPDGTMWNKGHKEKKFKFIKLLWNNLTHPIQTMRGHSCAYYAVGYKGLMPHGFVRVLDVRSGRKY